MIVETALTDRSSVATGIDLHLNSEGDLSLTDTGDLLVQSGQSSIRDNLLRRLQTSTSGYTRWVHTTKGLVKLNPGYGDAVYGLLSSPLTSGLIFKLQTVISEAAKKDDRIDVKSILVKRDTSNSIFVDLLYVIKGEAELIQLKTTLNV